MTFLRRLEVLDLRNIEEASLGLQPGLNVLVGRNAQGKTSLLEAVGLLARGRSFRTEHLSAVVSAGRPGLRVRGTAVDGGLETELEIAVYGTRRAWRVGGAEVAPREYQGRLEAQVYSTDRLRVVHGAMRERRQFFDRSAAALWPAYRQALREFERVLAQRNAALETGRAPLETWNEAFVELGARLRARRARYLLLLQEHLERGFRPQAERYTLDVQPHGLLDDEGEARSLLAAELAERARDEARARRTLVGPQRDLVLLRIGAEEAAERGSSGQARSLLLALTLAGLDVYRQERGTTAVALLDDLDSELDEERACALCRAIAQRGQALVTTAHPGWLGRLDGAAAVFHVEQGRVRPAAA